MTIQISHTFQSAVPDGTTPGMLEPSHWNAEHTVPAEFAYLEGVTSAIQTQLNSKLDAYLIDSRALTAGTRLTGVASGAATTLFALPQAGMYIVSVYTEDAESIAKTTTYAVIISNGTSARILHKIDGVDVVTPCLVLSLSGLDVKITQTITGSSNLNYSYIQGF